MPKTPFYTNGTAARELGQEGAFGLHGPRPAQPGLTKREYVAIAAMQGLCATMPGNSPIPAEIADEAVELADALLARLAEAHHE